VLTFPSNYSSALSSSFKENWIFRLYDKDGGYIGLSFADVTMDDTKSYVGAIVSAPTIRESINFATGTASTGNLTIECSDYDISSTKFSETLFTGNYVNQEVKVYSTLNSITAMADTVQIFTGRLTSVSLTETENVKLSIVVKRPWDDIEIPNDLSDTGVYVPVAYGTWGTTLKNPNATDRYPIPFLKSTGGDSTSGILYYTVPHSTSNAHDTAHYDKNIRQFVKVTGYQANTESSESVNNRLIRDTFERKYYFRPSSFTNATGTFLDSNGSSTSKAWTNLDNAIEYAENSSTGSSTYAQTPTLYENDGEQESVISFSLPNISGKINDATCYMKGQVRSTDLPGHGNIKVQYSFDNSTYYNFPDFNLDQTDWANQYTDFTHNSSGSGNDPMYGGTSFDSFDLKAWADSNNNGRMPEIMYIKFYIRSDPQGSPEDMEVHFKLYDIYFYSVVQNDFSNEPVASKQEVEAQDILYHGTPTSVNASGWATGTIQLSTISRIHRELLYTKLGITDTAYKNNDSTFGNGIKSNAVGRFFTKPNDPKPIKKYLDELAYEGGFVFRFDSQNRPVYHYIEDSPSADLSLTHSDVIDLKVEHTSLKELITQWSVQYEKNPAGSEYKQKATHTSSVRTNFFPSGSKENIKDAKLNWATSGVAKTNGNRNDSFLNYYNDMLGSVKQVVGFKIVNPTKSNIEVGDVISFSSMKINPLSGDWSTIKFITTDTTRGIGGQISVQAREI